MSMSYPGKNHVALLYKLQNTDRYRVSNKFNADEVTSKEGEMKKKGEL